MHRWTHRKTPGGDLKTPEQGPSSATPAINNDRLSSMRTSSVRHPSTRASPPAFRNGRDETADSLWCVPASVVLHVEVYTSFLTHRDSVLYLVASYNVGGIDAVFVSATREGRRRSFAGGSKGFPIFSPFTLFPTFFFDVLCIVYTSYVDLPCT